jgi:hypothetical protein
MEKKKKEESISAANKPTSIIHSGIAQMHIME